MSKRGLKRVARFLKTNIGIGSKKKFDNPWVKLCNSGMSAISSKLVKKKNFAGNFHHKPFPLFQLSQTENSVISFPLIRLQI